MDVYLIISLMILQLQLNSKNKMENINNAMPLAI